MLDENKNYWLYIAPHVYCRIEGSEAILYNTKNGQIIKTNDAENIDLLINLHDKTNLGAIYLEGLMLTTPSVKDFLLEFIGKGMGELLDIEQEKLKPIQMMPVLNLQQDIDRLQQFGLPITLKNTLHYLLELNLYLNSKCAGHCGLCQVYFKQNLCCTRSEESPSLELNPMDIRKILYQIKYSPVGKINLLGGDIFKYSHFHELPEILSGFEDRTHIWSHYANYNTVKDIMPHLTHDIIVTLPYHEDLFRSCRKKFITSTQNNYHFFITSENDYDIAESIIENHHIDHYYFHPVFTGKNTEFFEQNIYSDEEDIQNVVKSFRQIFANQKLNSNYFGILSVRPTGDVFANINSPSLGNVKEQTIIDLINHELIHNTAWRKTRNSSPCSHCLYQYLCPPPSNYEIALNKPNLCHVHSQFGK